MLLLASRGYSQSPLSNLVFTVGTTTSNNWSYVLVNASQPSLLIGKRFAVYGKAGYPTNAGTFTLRGNIFQQTDASAVNALLNQSVTLGQDLNLLNNAFAHPAGTNIVGLLHNAPGILGQTLPQRVLTAFQLANTDPAIAGALPLLANANPGLQLCAGHAFSEQIPGTTTYEVREINPATGAADYIVGRVTVVPGAPVVLPAPGQPFQVMTNSPSDNLLIRLRWGSPPELRRLAPLQFGYNVWRIPKSAAEAGNFNVTPPTIDQLYSNTNFTRANPAAAVFANKDFSTGSGAGAADDPADRTTYFIGDNGRSTLHTNFNPGDQFYYFITARDLLGRDGLASPGRLMTACRRLPPATPDGVHVQNQTLPGSTNQSRLQIVWNQNTNASDAVDQYWIYRWGNPTDGLSNDVAPLNNRIAVVAQLPGTNINVFLDDTPGARTNANPTNFWYTVRAVSTTACDPLLSPQCSPVWGVLRERTAPAVTTGQVVGSCGTPVVMFQNYATNSITPDAAWHVLLTCQRRDAGIASVTFVVTNVFLNPQTNGPIYFAPGADTVQTEVVIPAVATNVTPIWVTCSAATLYDQVSPPVTIILSGPIPSGQQKEVVFLAGQLLSTALSSSDPLLSILNTGGSICYSPTGVTNDPSGMIGLNFGAPPGTPLFIQAFVSNVWTDVEYVTPDANGFYWASYPACLVGPLPTFQGCTMNLPNDAGCDQHVASAAVPGPVAPLRIRFRLTPRTREFRIYRRADNGPLTLFSQGAATYDAANTNKIIEARDDAMPSVPSRLCYFVQLLDENGNGSPLAFIGCKEVKPGKIQQPVLSEPQPIGTVASPQVLLNWFCPTAGISRFEVKIKRLNGPTNGAPTGFTSLQMKLLPISVFNPKASYIGLNLRASALLSSFTALNFDEGQLTTPISAGFGPGPQFTLTANVLPNVNYLISVAPVDGQGKIIESVSSQAWPFTWTAPVQPANVPWPARPLPPVSDFDGGAALPNGPRVIAKVFYDSDGIAPNPQYPTGVRIGQLNPQTEPSENALTDNSYLYLNYFADLGNTTSDPNAGVFRSLGTGRVGHSLFPMILYRQEVTNSNFPVVSGNVMQVSPLIERVPWYHDFDTPRIWIPDWLFAGEFEFNTVTQNYDFFFYLRDLQPVQLGARYHYYVVRFNDKREVQEIISAGEVELPLPSN
jgi:hypothetical protein